MFKSIKAVAVAGAVALMSSSAFAAWDYFEVIEEGSAEGKITYDGGEDLEVKVRFGIMPNLEIMATNSVPFGMNSGFSLGARYQVVPEMLAVGVDLGIPTADYGEHDIGIAPSLQFHMGINDMISIGAGVGLGIDINRPNELKVSGNTLELETEAYMNLEFGLELGFQLTENFGIWVGCDFAMDLTYDDKDPVHVENGPTYGQVNDKGEAVMVIMPGFGISYTVANITVGADFGIDLYRTSRQTQLDALAGQDVEFGEDIGLNAAVSVSIAF